MKNMSAHKRRLILNLVCPIMCQHIENDLRVAAESISVIIERIFGV